MNNWKKYLSKESLVLALLISSLFFAVLLKVNTPEQPVLQPLTAEIPFELQRDPEISGFIKQTINTINYWSAVFNDLILEQKRVISENSKSNIYQQVRLINLSEKFLTEQNQFSKTCDSIYRRADVISTDLSSDKKNAFNQFIEQVADHEQKINVLSHSLLTSVASKN